MICLAATRQSFDDLQKIKHARRLTVNAIATLEPFTQKLLQIWSYKFYHATENKILSKSPGGATFQTTSSLRTEAEFFSKILV